MQVRRSNNAPFGRVEKSVALGIRAIAEFPAKVFITLMDVRFRDSIWLNQNFRLL